MRRIVSLLLSFVMIFALAACGQSAASEKQEEIQPAVRKTDELSETSQNGTTVEKQETEMETALLVLMHLKICERQRGFLAVEMIWRTGNYTMKAYVAANIYCITVKISEQADYITPAIYV